LFPPLTGDTPLALFPPLTGDTPLALPELAVLRVGDGLPLVVVVFEEPALNGLFPVGLELDLLRVGVELSLPAEGVEGLLLLLLLLLLVGVAGLFVGVAGLLVGVAGLAPEGVTGRPPPAPVAEDALLACRVGVEGRKEGALAVVGVDDLVGVAGRVMLL
jgi:hypothetical protein